MLTYLGAKPTATRGTAQKVIVSDLREEAVVYINETPFVLRELNKPVDTLKHVGITGAVVCLCSSLLPVLMCMQSCGQSISRCSLYPNVFPVPII